MGETQYLHLGGDGAGRRRAQRGELLGVIAADGLVYCHRDVEPQGLHGAVAGTLHIEIQHLFAEKGLAQICLMLNHLGQQGERPSDGGGLAHPRHA